MGDSTEKEKAEAYAIRLKAEAEARKADAEASKAAAEAAAVASKAAAEASKTAAETEALKSKAAAVASKAAAVASKAAAETAGITFDVRRAKVNQRIRWASLAAAAAGLAALAVDYYRNDYEPNMLARIKRRLRENHNAAIAAAALQQPTKGLLPVPAEPLQLQAGRLPTMVLAPTGAGKSTLLNEFAAKSARISPTMLIHFRQAADEQKKDEAKPVGTDPKITMGYLSSDVFRAIDYPERQSVIGWILRQRWPLPNQNGGGNTVELPAVLDSSSRLIHAFHLLFRASADIYREDKEARGDAARQCVLLFDEVQDLVKDERLAAAGGLEVFKQLASLLCAHCVNVGASVRAAVAGSSAELNVQFRERTVMRANRWEHYKLPDPESHVVVEALREKGMEAAAAQRLVDALGTRMRLLHAALTTPDGVLDVDAYIAKHMEVARSHVKALFRGLPAADARKVATLLDALAQGGTAEYSDVPAMVLPRLGQVLYVNLDESLRFQSVPHERVWREGGLRAEVWRGIQEKIQEKMQ